MYIIVLYACVCAWVYVCAPHIYRSPQRSKEGIEFFGTEVTRGCKLLSEFWAQNQCLLQEQYAFFPTACRSSPWVWDIYSKKLNSSNGIIRATLLIPDSFRAGVGERAAGEHCYSLGEQIPNPIGEYSTIKSHCQPQFMTVTRKDFNAGNRSTQNFCPSYYLRPNIPEVSSTLAHYK